MIDKIQVIKRIVAESYGVTVKAAFGKSRVPPLPEIRHMTMAIAYNLLSLSLPQLAREFGFSNHNTVAHGIEANRLRCQPEIGNPRQPKGEFDPVVAVRFRKIKTACAEAIKNIP